MSVLRSKVGSGRLQIAVLLMSTVGAAHAQDDHQPVPQQQPSIIRDLNAEVSKSSVGKVGERQTSENTPAAIRPAMRISERIHNRVQNRIRNRIDRYYDPTVNATEPFVRADEAATRLR